MCVLRFFGGVALARMVSASLVQVKGWQRQLVLDIGRSELSPAAATEYEYRRSVRRISAGIVPAVLAVAAVGPLTDWRHWNLHGVWAVLASLSWGASGLGMAAGLMGAVRYQEQVALWILLDTAFVSYWKRLAEAAQEKAGKASISPREASRRNRSTGSRRI